MIIKNFTITLLSLLFISSCSSNAGELSFMVNFPKSSKVLTESEKISLKKKIAVKNTEIFTDEELQALGVLEVVIK